MRNELKVSVRRLLDGPRFSRGLVNHGDLSWKGTNHHEIHADDAAGEECDPAAFDAAHNDAPSTQVSCRDWSSVGYDPKYRTIRRLSEQEELCFVLLAKAGDRFARQKLILHHLPLLKMIARRYADKGLALSELVNEGTFGLVRAIEGFDMGRELRFGTYAKWWIRDAIEQALLKQSRMIRLPGHVVRSLREQHRAEAQDSASTDSTDDATSSDSETAAVNVAAMLASFRPSDSGDEAAWDERSENKIDGADETTPEMIISSKQMQACLMRGLSVLSKRERYIVVQRFGLHSDAPDTLERVAADLGVSYERIRQIQKTALTKLKMFLTPYCVSAEH